MACFRQRVCVFLKVMAGIRVSSGHMMGLLGHIPPQGESSTGFSEGALNLARPWKLLSLFGGSGLWSPLGNSDGETPGDLTFRRPPSPRPSGAAPAWTHTPWAPKPLELEAASDLPETEWKIPGHATDVWGGEGENGLVQCGWP